MEVEATSSDSAEDTLSELDCCGAGCSSCILDIREKYKQKQKNIDDDVSNIRYDLLSPISYKPFKVINITSCTSDTYIYRFQPLEKASVNSDEISTLIGILPYKPTNHVIITTRGSVYTHKENTDFSNSAADNIKCKNISGVISRDYTPLSVACKQNNCILDILIKLYSTGRMSSFLVNLKPRDVVYMRGPFGDYSYVPNKYKIIYMFCAGTGIAPMYSLIQVITENEEDDTLVRLHYACRTINDILLRTDLRRFAQYWNFSAHIYLSVETSKLNLTDVYYGENIISGRITSVIVKDSIEHTDNCFVLICGTESFNNDIFKFVLECAVPTNQIYVFK